MAGKVLLKEGREYIYKLLIPFHRDKIVQDKAIIQKHEVHADVSF